MKKDAKSHEKCRGTMSDVLRCHSSWLLETNTFGAHVCAGAYKKERSSRSQPKATSNTKKEEREKGLSSLLSQLILYVTTV